MIIALPYLGHAHNSVKVKYTDDLEKYRLYKNGLHHDRSFNNAGE